MPAMPAKGRRMTHLFPVTVQGPETDERYTPRWVFDGLGLTFDLDPAAPLEGGDCVPARRRFTRADDGLVWLNPPFSAGTQWADRFRRHGHGVFLGPVANARWWMDLIRRADLMWHCRDLAFTHPLHAGRRSSMPLAMVAYGADAATGVERLARSGVHDGVLVRVVT